MPATPPPGVPQPRPSPLHDNDEDDNNNSNARAATSRQGDGADVTADALVARTAAECAVAFDLEVWKAQQQAALRAHLRKATAALEQRAAAERARETQQQMRALDETRAQLAAMAKRLHTASATLRQRTLQLEAREAAFDARRVTVAEQHERHLAQVEERARRAVQAARVSQDSLQAQLRERDTAVAQLQARLHAAETAYETLRRKAARHLVGSRHSASDADAASGGDALASSSLSPAAAARVQQALEEQLQHERTHATTLQRALRARDADVQRLTNDKVALEQQLQRCVDELNDVIDRYHHLRDGWHARERALRHAQRVTRRGRDRPSRTRTQQANDNNDNDDGDTHTVAALADDLVDMARSKLLQQLQRDVRATRDTNDTRSRRRGASPQTPHTQTVQPPPSRAPPRQTRDVAVQCDAAPVTTTTPLTSSQHASSHTQATTADDDTTADDIVRMASVSTASPPRRQRDDVDDVHDATAASPPSSSSSSSTSAYRTVDVDSWHSDNDDVRTADARHTTRDDDSHRHVGAATATAALLPPLAPSPSTPPCTTSATASLSPHVSSPLPHEFVQATQHGDDSTAATRADMMLFVEQLRNNRRKLLDTGVYVASDAVVQEMGEKIRLYERYLAEHL